MEKGTSILHYEILDKLGEGGMGLVYKATDTKLRRTVSLKFLPPHLTQSKSDQQRFLREARAAASLNHSNICGIHAVEEFEDQHFISMEFIDGVTLGEKLKTGELTTFTALEYAIKIADALAEAHENGIVHRDIKPGNIMVDSKDRIKVMDFGLAKLAGSAPITKSGTTVGTMAYMAPEQIQGRPVDHRADLFSFGVLLFEMLTGQRPFTGQYDAALTYSIVNEEPPLLTDFLPDAPQKLSLLVSRLLEKDPAKRYSDSEQLASELKFCLDQLPDSIEASKITPSTTSQAEAGDSSSSDSNSVTINFPSLRSRNGMLSLAGIVIVLALIGYWLFPITGSESTPSNNKIAVLPLESISTEPEDIQFTDGVHEELINRLAGINDLTVIARSSVLGFEPRQRDLQSIAQQLDVSSLMEGTVRRIGDQLRVSVQLIDANSLATLWSGSFDENIDNVFEIQSRIARQVAGELQASLSQEEQERLQERPTDNPQAYRFYMQGREYLSRIINEDNLLTAERFLSQAAEQDGEFAQAWGMLAYTYSQLYWYHGSHPDDLQKLEEAAEWALFYGPELPETYLANGVKLYWTSTDNRQILSHFEAALQKYPNHPILNTMTAFTHRRLGNWEELIKYLKNALELDPLKTNIYTELAWDYMLMRDYEQALETVDHLMELELNPTAAFQNKALYRYFKDGTLEGYEEWWDYIRPSDPAIEQPYWWGYFNTLIRNWEEAIRGYQNINNEVIMSNDALYILLDYMMGFLLDFQDHRTQALDYYRQARTHLEALRDEYPNDFRFRTALGKVYAHLDEDEKAVQEGEKAAQLMPLSEDAYIGGVVEQDLAEIYAWTGHEELAIETLEHLLSVPSRVHRNDLRIDPKWDPLRGNPRFQELIAGEDEPYLEGL